MSRSPLSLAVALACAPMAMAQEWKSAIEELNERLDEIEDQQLETSEKVAGTVVNAFSADSLHLGGHVTSLFTHMEGESSSDTGHMVSLVELFVKAKLNDEWSLFAAPGFYTFNGALLDNPATPTVAMAIRPSSRTTASDREPVRVPHLRASGRRATCSRCRGASSERRTACRTGSTSSRRAPLRQNPLHTRIFLANQLYPQQINGLKASGKYSVGDTDWIEYDAYFGSQSDSAGLGTGGLRLGYGPLVSSV